MPRRRNKDDLLNFEIHVDDSCLPEVMSDGAGSFDATEPKDAAMARPSSTTEPMADSEGSDATILNSIEDDHVELDERRESGLSVASYESDRRPPSRQQSEFHRPARDSWSVSGDRRSVEGSGGRVSTGDSSSQHEQDDDVFSDHSPRSSTGSNVEADHLKQSHTDSRRTTGGSRISDMQPYDPDEEFVPTVRETPRPPFRSPSSVRAMQMNSPPASVTGSARSNRRATRSSISRIGSPAVSTQFSPKKTPPRFKRSTPPLVLLHVTLLPLRWPWGDLMDNARPSELSEAVRNLREAWKQLQTRLGDTVSDRGVLLPHPQSDFEILEERLLEAMELPLQRRARILECGHYLGPANEMAMAEDGLISDEEGYDEQPIKTEKRHWCSTCQSDIRYDSLGEGKIFRTKVYASNGLMKAGAWDACWKEMERVDVELEPIVDPSVVDELERIAATQEREAIEAEIAASTHMGGGVEEEREAFSPEEVFDESPSDEDSRKLYEERMREIYGQTEYDEGVANHAQPEAAAAHEEAATTAPKTPSLDIPRKFWEETLNYGFRDAVQLVIFVAFVFLLQYFGIGFDKKGANSANPAEKQTPQQHDILGGAVTGRVASQQGSSAVSAASLAAKVQGQYAACTSALEAAEASLVLASTTATVTVTETVTASAVATEEPAVKQQEDSGHKKPLQEPESVRKAESVHKADAPLGSLAPIDEEQLEDLEHEKTLQEPESVRKVESVHKADAPLGGLAPNDEPESLDDATKSESVDDEKAEL